MTDADYISQLETAIHKVPELRKLALSWGMEPVALDKGDGFAHGNPKCGQLGDATVDLEREILGALREVSE